VQNLIFIEVGSERDASSSESQWPPSSLSWLRPCLSILHSVSSKDHCSTQLSKQVSKCASHCKKKNEHTHVDASTNTFRYTHISSHLPLSLNRRWSSCFPVKLNTHCSSVISRHTQWFNSAILRLVMVHTDWSLSRGEDLEDYPSQDFKPLTQ